MSTIREVFSQTDWTLLRDQKEALFATIGANPNLDGLVLWIDALQDAAAEEGYPVIFADNNNCSGSRCTDPSAEVRVLPTGGEGNMILCEKCYEHEMRVRRDRNGNLALGAKFELPTWQSLEVYSGT